MYVVVVDTVLISEITRMVFANDEEQRFRRPGDDAVNGAGGDGRRKHHQPLQSVWYTLGLDL